MTAAADIAKRLLEDEEDFDPKEYAMALRYFLQPIETAYKEAYAVTLTMGYASCIGRISYANDGRWIAVVAHHTPWSVNNTPHRFATKEQAADWVYKIYQDWSKQDVAEAEEEEEDPKEYIMSRLPRQPLH